MLSYFEAGLGIGFYFTFTHIPSQVRCYNATKSHGFLAGIATGLGSAVVQFIFSWLALSFLFAQGDASAHLSKILVIIGGVLLLLFGFWQWKFIWTQEELKEAVLRGQEETDDGGNLWMFFWKCFVASSRLSRRIVGYLLLFLAVGLTFQDTPVMTAFPLVIGIVIGTLLWWLGFTVWSVFLNVDSPSAKVAYMLRLGAIFFVVMAVVAFYQGFGPGFRLIH